jgi:DUF4097 and DUF4098 domain-containing protein YvlB
MRTYKNILTMISLFIMASSILAMNEDRDRTKSFSVRNGEKLYTDLNQGDIKIKTWNKEEVLIQVRGVESDEIKNLYITYENHVVSVKSDDEMDSEELTLQVTVPDKFDLDLKTRGGNISVMDPITGEVTVSTYGGDLFFDSIKGDLRAETNGGNIVLKENVDGLLDINTMGGDISLGKVNGKSAKVNTMGGEISIGKSLSGITVKTYGGDISVGDTGGDSEFITFGGNISTGNVNGNIRMETNGGNLELKGANGKVKAKTSGGNVDFKKIKGSVDVRTSAGEVAVELDPASGSESKIMTSAGSIELTVSASAKVIIEARIHVQGWWKNAKENFKILSDFDMENYRSDDASHDIVGTYILNGGGSKIFLRSVNDVITIKKK